MSVSSEVRKILTLLFGVANTAAGGFCLYRVMQQATPDRHVIYVFVGWIALGSLMIAPSTLVSAAKQLFALLPSIKVGPPQ